MELSDAAADAAMFDDWDMMVSSVEMERRWRNDLGGHGGQSGSGRGQDELVVRRDAPVGREHEKLEAERGNGLSLIHI